MVTCRIYIDNLYIKDYNDVRIQCRMDAGQYTKIIRELYY